jgi:hypothetical protein
MKVDDRRFNDAEIQALVIQLAKERDAAYELLKSLIVDVEAMERDVPFDFELELKENPEYNTHWFGGFEIGHTDVENSTTSIQWPCLGILINQAKELTKE